MKVCMAAAEVRIVIRFCGKGRSKAGASMGALDPGLLPPLTRILPRMSLLGDLCRPNQLDAVLQLLAAFLRRRPRQLMPRALQEPHLFLLDQVRRARRALAAALLLLALLVEVPPVLLLFLMRNVNRLVLVLVPVGSACTK